MGLVTWGIVIWVVGKIAKAEEVAKIGMYMVIGGALLFGLGFFGINLPLPISAI